jgi:hypothetical protein
VPRGQVASKTVRSPMQPTARKHSYMPTYQSQSNSVANSQSAFGDRMNSSLFTLIDVVASVLVFSLEAKQIDLYCIMHAPAKARMKNIRPVTKVLF